MMKDRENQGIESFLKMPVALVIPMILYMGFDLCNFTLTHPNLQALYGRKYDLVIVEIFGSDSMLGLGQQFDAPVIAFSTFSTSRWTNDLIGNPSPLSYVSHPMLDFPDQMNIWHRIYNTVFYVYESIVLNLMSHPLQVKIEIQIENRIENSLFFSQRAVYSSAFPNATKTYDEVRNNVALLFVNSHFSLARPLPYVRFKIIIKQKCY